VGIDIIWKGQGVEEVGINAANGEILVDINPRYFRPSEVEFLYGDCSRAEKELGWKRKVDFNQLVRMMVEHDLHR